MTKGLHIVLSHFPLFFSDSHIACAIYHYVQSKLKNKLTIYLDLRCTLVVIQVTIMSTCEFFWQVIHFDSNLIFLSLSVTQIWTLTFHKIVGLRCYFYTFCFNKNVHKMSMEVCNCVSNRYAFLSNTVFQLSVSVAKNFPNQRQVLPKCSFMLLVLGSKPQVHFHD